MGLGFPTGMRLVSAIRLNPGGYRGIIDATLFFISAPGRNDRFGAPRRRPFAARLRRLHPLRSIGRFGQKLAQSLARWARWWWWIKGCVEDHFPRRPRRHSLIAADSCCRFRRPGLNQAQDSRKQVLVPP
jgi:hypothetical protein